MSHCPLNCLPVQREHADKIFKEFDSTLEKADASRCQLIRPIECDKGSSSIEGFFALCVPCEPGRDCANRAMPKEVVCRVFLRQSATNANRSNSPLSVEVTISLLGGGAVFENDTASFSKSRTLVPFSQKHADGLCILTAKVRFTESFIEQLVFRVDIQGNPIQTSQDAVPKKRGISNFRAFITLNDIQVAESQEREDSKQVILNKFCSRASFDLSEFEIVPGYLRADAHDRLELTRLVDKFRDTFGVGKSVGHFLIWGDSGAGKTKFVKSISSALKIQLFEFSGARGSRADYSIWIQEVISSVGDCLCLVDECDSDKCKDWLFSDIFDYLKPRNEMEILRKCFVFLGSTGGSVAGLESRLRSCDKGDDLCNRLTGENRIELRGSKRLEDKLVMFCVKLLEHTKRNVLDVQSSVFYFLCSKPLEDLNNHFLDSLAKSVAGRIQGLPTGMILVEHLAPLGSEDVRNFFRDFKMEDVLIRVSSDKRTI